MRILGVDPVLWCRKVRKCRRMKLEGATRIKLQEFMSNVEAIRDDGGEAFLPRDIRMKMGRVQLMLGCSQDPTEQDSSIQEEIMYSCVECSSKCTLDENYQCPECGQNYCCDCVDLESEQNHDQICNRCLERSD